jgi:hypothetical protein
MNTRNKKKKSHPGPSEKNLQGMGKTKTIKEAGEEICCLHKNNEICE